MTSYVCRSASVAIAVFLAALLAVTGFASGASAAPISEATTIDDIRWSEEFQPEHADLLRLYRAFFDRAPEATGAQYWIDQYNNGASFDDIAWSFANGAEFQSRYGATSDRQFLTIVYQNVLGRAYDQTGFDYWLGQIQTGELTRSGVVRWISASAEFRARRPQAPAEFYAQALLKASDLRAYILSETELTAPSMRAVDLCDDDEDGLRYGSITNALDHSDGSGTAYGATIIPYRTSAEASDDLHTFLAPYVLSCLGFGPAAGSGVGQESFAATSAPSIFFGTFEIHFVRQNNVVIGLLSLDQDNGEAVVLLNKMQSRL